MDKPRFQKLLLILMLFQWVTLACVVVLLLDVNKAFQQTEPGERFVLDVQQAVVDEPSADPIAHEELQTIIRETIQKELAAKQFINKPAQAVHIPEHLLAKQQEAAVHSGSILIQALSTGVWTGNNTTALMTYLPDLSEQDRIVFLEQFHQAVNRQELVLEDFPPL